MTENSSTHWAADEETLERFVLGKLDETERSAAEAHIASCASCADAVRAERRLAAGARRLGRDSLKASLRRRTGESRERTFLYPAMLSAAAVLGILVGVGFYNNWFKGEIQDISTIAENRQDAEFARPEEKMKSERRVDASAADSKEQKKDVASPVARAETDKPALSAAQHPAAGANQITGAGTRGDVPPAPANAQEAAPVRMRDEGSARKAASAVPTVLWAEGVLLERTGVHGSLDAAAKVETESRVLKMEKKANAKTADQLSVGGQSTRLQTGNFRVNQRPASALPADRQLFQQQSLQNTVQTLVEQRGNLTTMTLYLDSLADDRDLSGANVSNVTADSVIVTLGKQRIGYKLPSGLARQQQNTGK